MMDYILNHPWVMGTLLTAFLALVLDFGRFTGIYFAILENPYRKEQMATMRDGLFVLLSLLLGFSLTLAAARFADRRSLLVEEAVSLATTYLRSGTLTDTYRDHSQSLLRQYVDTQLDLDQLTEDNGFFAKAMNRAKELKEELWSEATAVAKSDRSPITAIYLTSLNETIDLHEKRVAAFENRIPYPIWLLITWVSVIAVFMRGITVRSRFWVTLIVIPMTVAIVVTLIADLDATSSGLIRLDERALERLQTEMRAPSR